MMDDCESLFADFESLGEEVVRGRLASGEYSSRLEINCANEWLRRKAQERSDKDARRNEASQSEQTEIARSAKDAAWSAASAARDAANEAREQLRIARAANTRATIALIIAALSAAMLIIDVIRRLLNE
jgi:hypothetical protein